MNSQIKFWIMSFCALLILNSCMEDKEYEILTSEAILPEVKGDYNYSEDTLFQEVVELSEFKERLKLQFPELSFDIENSLKDRKTLFMPDRLGFKDKEEAYFVKDSIPFHFIEWTFIDSVKTTSAFYNWLDCFGPDCRSIRINEEKNASKEGFLIWVTDNKISYLASTQRISVYEGEKIVFDNSKKVWYYIVQQAPRRKIKWVFSSVQKED